VARYASFKQCSFLFAKDRFRPGAAGDHWPVSESTVLNGWGCFALQLPAAAGSHAPNHSFCICIGRKNWLKHPTMTASWVPRWPRSLRWRHCGDHSVHAVKVQREHYNLADCDQSQQTGSIGGQFHGHRGPADRRDRLVSYHEGAIGSGLLPEKPTLVGLCELTRNRSFPEVAEGRNVRLFSGVGAR
jgi:hypothetical protein